MPDLGILASAMARSKPNAYNIILDYQDFDFADGIRILEMPNSSNLRRMFLSQPPARQVEVFICSRGKCVPRCYGHGFRTTGILPFFHVRDKQGITLGQVIDTAKRCIARHSDQERLHIAFAYHRRLCGTRERDGVAEGAWFGDD